MLLLADATAEERILLTLNNNRDDLLTTRLTAFTVSPLCQMPVAAPVANDQLLNRLRSGLYTRDDVDAASKLGLQVAVVEALSQQFRCPRDELHKHIAATDLVKLRVEDPKYWAYLDQASTALVEVSGNVPLTFATDGRLGETPALKSWALSHKMSVSKVMENTVYTWPGMMLSLGGTGDARAIPILRRGLESKNIFMAMAAAKGLAELQDEGAIPDIIALCQQAPHDAVIAIADNLVYFKNSRLAQAAAEMYLPADQLKLTRERVQQGKTPLSN